MGRIGEELKKYKRILIATAIEEGVEAFITNDIRLKNIDEINCIIINDYL